MTSSSRKDHFQGQTPLEHLAQMKVKGLIFDREMHGSELSGFWAACLDAFRDTAFILALFAILVTPFTDSWLRFLFLLFFTCGWTIWKTGRSAWLGWSRLERLHRLLEQERWEIEHNRSQEREELRALYRAKGLEGQLLEDVVDTLMADGDRLLRVMVEEELGLTLEMHEHPLKQASGAALGALTASLLCLGAILIFPYWGLYATALLLIGIGAGSMAYYEGNRLIPAILWTAALAVVGLGTSYFFLDYLMQ